jgi:hypothetical protein
MTVDELVKLTEALVGDFSITMLFEGAYANQLMGFDDASKALLVRFLAGERPEIVPVATIPRSTHRASVGALGVTQQIQQQPDDDDDDDDDEFVIVPPRDPNKPLILGGDFAAEGTIQLP